VCVWSAVCACHCMVWRAVDCKGKAPCFLFSPPDPKSLGTLRSRATRAYTVYMHAWEHARLAPRHVRLWDEGADGPSTRTCTGPRAAAARLAHALCLPPFLMVGAGSCWGRPCRLGCPSCALRRTRQRSRRRPCPPLVRRWVGACCTPPAPHCQGPGKPMLGRCPLRASGPSSPVAWPTPHRNRYCWGYPRSCAVNPPCVTAGLHTACGLLWFLFWPTRSCSGAGGAMQPSSPVVNGGSRALIGGLRVWSVLRLSRGMQGEAQTAAPAKQGQPACWARADLKPSRLNLEKAQLSVRSRRAVGALAWLSS